MTRKLFERECKRKGSRASSWLAWQHAANNIATGRYGVAATKLGNREDQFQAFYRKQAPADFVATKAQALGIQPTMKGFRND